MTSTNKGNYQECITCIFRIKYSENIVCSEKYPCYYSHKAVRGLVKYERDFTKCLLKSYEMI